MANAEPIQTLAFLSASDLLTQQEMSVICDFDPNFTWGDNDHSMISLKRLKAWVTDNLSVDDISGYDGLLKRLDKYDSDLFVDLET